MNRKLSLISLVLCLCHVTATAQSADSRPDGAKTQSVKPEGAAVRQPTAASQPRVVLYDDNGNVGIGSESTGSRLLVAGTVESTTGGIKFPDATVQTTAGMAAVATAGPISGNGTAASPLTIAGPLDVRVVNPTAEPFYGSASGRFGTIYPPFAKAAVIESITGTQSVTTIGQSGPFPERLTISIQNQSQQTVRQYFIYPSFIYSKDGSDRMYYNQRVRIVLNSGESLMAHPLRSDEAGWDFSVWGYVVDPIPVAGAIGSKPRQ